MMNKIKKILGLGLVLSLTLGLFVGCGQVSAQENENKIEFDETKSILEEYVVPIDCALIGQKVWDLPLPKSAMVVSVVRSGNTLIPDEDLRVKYADELFVIMNYKTYYEDNKEIEKLIYNNWKEEKS